MNSKTVVIKVGTSVVTTDRNKIDYFRLTHLFDQMEDLHKKGYNLLIVSSGAVACGVQDDFCSIDDSEACRRLAAGIGQAYIISHIQQMLYDRNMRMAQILITKSDFNDTKNREAIARTIKLAFQKNILPIVNENDIVDLRSFGGNDYLASELAILLKADYLLLLSDVEGVYDSSKNVLRVVGEHNVDTIGNFSQIKSAESVGGIQGKIQAGINAANHGISVHIASGMEPDTLVSIISEPNGTIGTKIVSSV